MADQKVPGGPPPETQPGMPYPQGQPTGAPPPYPPGNNPYPQQQGPQYQQTTVVAVQPMGAVNGGTCRYTQIPAVIICQHCGAQVTTSTTYEVGLLTWAACGIICLFGCWLGCCLIPFCVDAAKDVSHSCPNCNQMVGKFRHFS